MNRSGTFESPADPLDPLTMKAEETKKCLHEVLSNATFLREDYRELVELVYIWLGGETLPGGRTFKFRVPGTFHQARFMSKTIYLIEMALLSSRITLVQDECQIVQRMAVFIGLFYARYFLRSRIAAFAPLDDYNFYVEMVEFKEQDEKLASAVLTSISRHFWYKLSLKLISFSSFIIFHYIFKGI